MNKEKALENNRREMELLVRPSDPQIPQSAPAESLALELEQITEDLHKERIVPERITDAGMLIRALSAPTQVYWSEPSGRMKRDPVSGNLLPETCQKSEAGVGASVLFEIKDNLVTAVRALAAHAKSIGSPSFGELREIHLMLTAWFAHHSMIYPVNEETASEVVTRLGPALFTLWADNEIEKEVRHG